MKILKIRDSIRSIVEYCKQSRRSYYGETLKAIDALDPETTTVDELRAALGDKIENVKCHECYNSIQLRAMEFGDEFLVCESCIRKAMAMLEGGQ